MNYTDVNSVQVREFGENFSGFELLRDQFSKNNTDFDLLIFVGRFQPFHVEHKRIVEIALQKSKNVLVLVGSSGKARTVRNPFNFEERMNMIGGCFQEQYLSGKLQIKPLYDKTYNDAAWVKQVQDIVKETMIDIANPGELNRFKPNGIGDLKVGLIGASKDNTSYYLKLFPQFESVDVKIEQDIHATQIREMYLEGKIKRHEVQDSLLPKEVCDILFMTEGKPGSNAFDNTSEYLQLQREMKFVKDYKKQWSAAPYPVKHVTVDALVEQSGHILLIRRRSEPGKGLWALPGGHLNEYERIEDGAVRELREEVKMKVPEPVLRGSIINDKVFDDPHRSAIGRIITHAVHIKLKDDVKLPKVKGTDDADKARWAPISELREDEMYDDHFHMAMYFLGLN